MLRRIDQPALKVEPRLLGQNDGLAGADADKGKPALSIGRRRGTAGRHEDAGTGNRASLAVMNPPRQLLERLKANGGNRGAFAGERDPVGDKGHKTIVADGHAVARTVKQDGWSLKNTLRARFQRLRVKAENLVGRDPPVPEILLDSRG